MDLKGLCGKVIALSKDVGDFIRQERKKFSGLDIESKGRHNFVTYVDKTAEKKIIDGLKNLIEGAGFIAEEGTNTNKSDKFNWIIDPLDGTTNYIHGAPPYAISIALMELGEIILGVIYEIVSDECFYSFKGSDSFLNGQKISVSDTSSVSESLIGTGFPYQNYNRLDNFMKTLDHFFYNSHGVRRLGSAATDMAYVACGRYDAFYEHNLQSWDVAAGVIIIENAGGKVSDFRGGNKYLFGKEIVAANSYIFDEFQKVVGKFMNV